MNDLLRILLKLQELQFGDVTGGSVEKAIWSLRRKIPKPILDHYDRLAAQGKKGIAIVRNQVCGGCHMRIPIGAVITLMHGDDILTCDICTRYLYLPPDVRNLPSNVAGEERSVMAEEKTLAVTRT